MKTPKKPSQLELTFSERRPASQPKPTTVIELSSARRRIEARARGSIYESIISRAAHLSAGTPSVTKKKG